MLAATGESAGELTYEPLTTDGPTRVRSTTSFKLRFDRYLLPASATRQALCVQPFLKKVNGLQDCVGPLFLGSSYDPVRREVTYRQSPSSLPMIAGTTYRLTAFVPADALASGFRAFDGAPLGASATFDVLVDDAGTTPPYDPIPERETFCRAITCSEGCASDQKASVKACQETCTDPACELACVDACVARCPTRGVLDALAGCAVGGCHGYADPQQKSVYPGPAMGLDLTGGEGLAATAVGQVAHGAQTGEHARTPGTAPARFGRAMPLLDPGNPGNSYLLYKVLAGGVPDSPADLAEGEVERLRAAVLTGMPMPPGNARADAFLSEGDASLISTWLQQGASVDECGPGSVRP